MIGDLARAVGTDLAGRLFPYRVSYGPERVARDGFNVAVVFRRDRSAADEIAAPVGATRPRATAAGAESPLTRWVSGACFVYARSPKPAATVQDHEDECDAVCDAVLTAMYRILKAKCLPWRVAESRLLTRDDLRAEAETDAGDDGSGLRSADAPGCAARIRFAVQTLVRDVTYTGASAPVGTITEFATPVVEARIVAKEEDP